VSGLNVTHLKDVSTYKLKVPIIDP